MSLKKVAWYVFRVNNMYPGSPLHTSWTFPAEAKLRCVYSILKPHSQSWSKAVVCVSTPRMYPCSGYFLVTHYLNEAQKNVTHYSDSDKILTNAMYTKLKTF